MTKARIKVSPAMALSFEILISDNLILPLEHKLYLHYTILFKRNYVKTQALIDFGSKINAMTPVYTSKLGFKV